MKLWWYTARATGLVGWGILAASVLLGLLLSTRLTRKPAPVWSLALHRFLGGLAVAFTGVHLAGLVADSYAHFGPAELFVPLASRWRPGAVAWGVAAFYLLVAVEITSLAMRRLSKRAWRRIHLSSFALYLFATLHGITAGTDVTSPAMRWSFIGTTLAVIFLLLVRILSPRSALTRERRAARAARPDARAEPAGPAPRAARTAIPPAPDPN